MEFSNDLRKTEYWSDVEQVVPPIPAPPRRLLIETTKFCSVGCSFCKYSAPLPKGDSPKSLTKEYFKQLVSLANNYMIPEAVLTGGGEPTDDWEFLKYAIDSLQTSIIHIYTAGQWGITKKESERKLLELYDVLSKSSNKKLVIRLSVDDFHFKKIGIEPVENIIRTFVNSEEFQNKISINIRTTINYSDCFQDLINSLDATLMLENLDSGILKINKVEIPFWGMNLVPDGRVSGAFEKRLSFEEMERALTLGSEKNGIGWPVLYKGGLNLGVRPTGKLYIYGGSPINYGYENPHYSFGRLERDLINWGIYILGVKGFYLKMKSEIETNHLSKNILNEPSLLIPKLLNNLDSVMKAKRVGLTALLDSKYASTELLGFTQRN